VVLSTVEVSGSTLEVLSSELVVPASLVSDEAGLIEVDSSVPLDVLTADVKVSTVVRDTPSVLDSRGTGDETVGSVEASDVVMPVVKLDEVEALEDSAVDALEEVVGSEIGATDRYWEILLDSVAFS
jgi:hypothetical protein